MTSPSHSPHAFHPRPIVVDPPAVRIEFVCPSCRRVWPYHRAACTCRPNQLLRPLQRAA